MPVVDTAPFGNRPRFCKLNRTLFAERADSSRITCATQPVSQPSLEISPILTIFVTKEVRKLQRISA